MLARLLRPFVRGDTYRTLLFVLLAVPVSGLWVTLVLAGWTVAAILAITPLVVPALIALGGATRFFGTTERLLARELLGLELGSSPPTPGATGFWGRGFAVLRDGVRWKEQAYFLVRLLLGGLVAVALLSWLYVALFLIALPITYRWLDSTDVIWAHVDTPARAIACMPAGVVLLVAGIHLIRPVRAASRRLARGLLAVDERAEPKSSAEQRASRRRALAIHAEVIGAVNLILLIVWATTSGGYVWPIWPLAATGLAVASHGWVVLVLDRFGDRLETVAGRGAAIYAGVATAVFLYLVSVWALAGAGYFWPVWPLVGLLVPLAVYVIVVRLRPAGREELVERIELLETTRAGAVDAQETELRRIERDLHDGAQARLVALGMSIGMAEQKLASDPEAAQRLLAEARRGAQDALVELRDLARGIHPPILTDRGLHAAVAALVDRTPLHVTLLVHVPDRPSTAVESAAYFVVAEALANAGKHAEATSFTIRIERARDVLVVEVLDDGKGGADPTGNGLSGLRRRVQALDGTLRVTSPAGGPTVIRAEVPCVS
jgi:signal transduction histidine kinase